MMRRFAPDKRAALSRCELPMGNAAETDLRRNVSCESYPSVKLTPNEMYSTKKGKNG